jgi:hypothetical protein
MIYSHAGHDIDLPLPRIRHFGEAGVGVLPEGEEFLVMLDGFGLSRFILVYVTSQFSASDAPRNSDP